jgi:hypothetical protein
MVNSIPGSAPSLASASTTAPISLAYHTVHQQIHRLVQCVRSTNADFQNLLLGLGTVLFLDRSLTYNARLTQPLVYGSVLVSRSSRHCTDMDADPEHSKTKILVIVASVVVAVITFVVTRYFVTKEAVKQASPSGAAPNPSLSVKKPSSINKTLSQFGQLDPALVAALTGTATPHDSNSGGARPAASLNPPQPQDLLTPSVPWSRTTSSLAPPLVSSRPSSRPPSRPRCMYHLSPHGQSHLHFP